MRAIVVTGAGSSFCSGVDSTGGARSAPTPTPSTTPQLGVTSETIWERVAYWRLKTPVIGAINGARDRRGHDAPAALRHPLRGRGRQALVRLHAARHRAGSELHLAGAAAHRLVDGASTSCCPGASSAVGRRPSGGWRHRRFPPTDVLPAALELAHDIADNTAPLSVAITKQLIYDFMDAADRPARDQPGDEAHLVGRRAAGRARGVMSWVEKRPADWKVSKQTSSRRADLGWSARGGGRGQERRVRHRREHGLQRRLVEAGGARSTTERINAAGRVHGHARFARRELRAARRAGCRRSLRSCRAAPVRRGDAAVQAGTAPRASRSR